MCVSLNLIFFRCWYIYNKRIFRCFEISSCGPIVFSSLVGISLTFLLVRVYLRRYLENNFFTIVLLYLGIFSCIILFHYISNDTKPLYWWRAKKQNKFYKLNIMKTFYIYKLDITCIMFSKLIFNLEAVEERENLHSERI